MPCAVLIVDDSAIIRRTLRYFLEHTTACRVCGEAGDGKEAIEQARRLHPDLVLLDLSMPKMNGFEAARALKRENPELQVLLFTSFKTPGLEKQAIEAGCTAVVSKTEPQERLVENIKRLVTSRN
jgi:DNA-binding NarL/FixJ family response regulator